MYQYFEKDKKYIYIKYIFFNCCNKVNELFFTYNFDNVCKFHATTFHWFDFFPKVSTLQCRLFPKFGPEILQMSQIYFYYQGIFNMYLSKHSWNTKLCSPNTHQDGRPPVSHVSYHLLWALSMPLVQTNVVCFLSASQV